MEKAPRECPWCGANGTLVSADESWRCTDPYCGRFFPKTYPGLNRVPGKRTRSDKKAAKSG